MYDLARVLDRCKEGGKRVEKRVEGANSFSRREEIGFSSKTKGSVPIENCICQISIGFQQLQSRSSVYTASVRDIEIDESIGWEI